MGRIHLLMQILKSRLRSDDGKAKVSQTHIRRFIEEAVSNYWTELFMVVETRNTRSKRAKRLRGLLDPPSVISNFVYANQAEDTCCFSTMR